MTFSNHTEVDTRLANYPTRHEFDGLSSWIRDIDDKMAKHTQQEIRMESRLDELEKDVSEIKTDVKQLLEVWTEAKGAVKFLTILISVLASGWAAVLWIKDHVRL